MRSRVLLVATVIVMSSGGAAWGDWPAIDKDLRGSRNGGAATVAVRVNDYRLSFEKAGAVGWLSGDVLGDGRPELVVSLWNAIRFYEASGGEVGSIPTALLPRSLADVDGDGKLEVVVVRTESNYDYTVLAYNADGSVAAQAVVGGTGQADQSLPWVHVADVDGDGGQEVVSLGWSGYAVKWRGIDVTSLATGARKWRSDIGPFPLPVRAADLGGRRLLHGTWGPNNGRSGADGTNDCTSYTLAYTPASGAPAWRRVQGTCGFHDSTVFLPDLDGDGVPDVVATSTLHDWAYYDRGYGRINVLDRQTGADRSLADLGHQVVTLTGAASYFQEAFLSSFGAFGQLDYLAGDEIVVGTLEGATPHLRSYGANLTPKGSFSRPSGQLWPAAVADLTGDGVAEVMAVYRSSGSNDKLLVLNGSLTQLLREIDFQAPAINHVLVDDLDQNGTLEIVAWCLDGSAPAKLAVWSASPSSARALTFSHLAGTPGGGGAVDGLGPAARFAGPYGIAVDRAGTVYVADTDNHAIRKVTPGGLVTTLAGLPRTPGATNGLRSAARFAWPHGIAVDEAGTVYVADANYAIRKVTSDGAVTTFAGFFGSPGTADGTGSEARFSRPVGVAVDSEGTVYVADAGAHTIRKISPTGVVTTLAGSPGQSGTADGAGSAARFQDPAGLAVDLTGVVYVADNQTIRRVTPTGMVTTLAGLAGFAGNADGTGSGARFNGPTGVAVDASGTVYVSEFRGSTIRRVTPDGVVTTVAGAAGAGGTLDGAGRAARFFNPYGVAASVTGTLFVADTYNCTIRKVTRAGVVTTVAGSPPVPGSADATGSAARFHGPQGVAVDGTGLVYVADTYNCTIRRVTARGAVTTLAGLAGDCNSADGGGNAARFSYPGGVAADDSGVIYVADTSNHTIRRVTADGVVTTLAGLARNGGSADGTGSAARFFGPLSVAVDPGGNVYVADTGNYTVRKVTPDGLVTTLAGLAGQRGNVDGTGSTARFGYPMGVAVDGAGTVYVADAGNLTVRKVTPDGVVTTLATVSGPTGSSLAGLAVDAAGRIYVADSWNYTVSIVTPEGAVMTAGGVERCMGSTDGEPSAARFSVPYAVAVDRAGVVYVADVGNNAIRRGGPADGDGDGLPDYWERQFGVDPTSAAGADGAEGDPDGDGLTNEQEHASGTHPRGIYARYLAEGATGNFFDLRMALLNPGETGATATLAFSPAGQAPVTTVVLVPARTRVTVTPNTIAGLATSELSTKVEADVPLVVDRTMSWDKVTGYGAHSETAVVSPALTWYLAEGATHSGFNLFYLLQNPNAAEAQVRVRYLRPDAAPLEKTYALPPASRTNIWVDYEEFPAGSDDRLLEGTDVSAVCEVLNGQPIIVERAMYADAPGQFFGAGHESAGVTAPEPEWFLAEGATGPYFDLFLLVANPGPTGADVEATYLLPDGTTVVKRYSVTASSRFNIWVDYEDERLADTAVSTTLRSTNGVPIVVERAMWWPGTSTTWHGAHNSPGATTTGTRWALAEGEVDTSRNLETYLLVANTSTTPADVRVMLFFEDGATAEEVYPGIPARSRFNVPVGVFFPKADGKRFGAVVESLGPAPARIVVERATYWDAAGQQWAAGTNALPMKLQ